jgi:hypothetical protein
VDLSASTCDFSVGGDGEHDAVSAGDPEALKAWVTSIKPSDFSTPEVERFFQLWEAGNNPELDSSALYKFSGTPADSHAAALDAIESWSLPLKPHKPPEDEGPQLHNFTGGLQLP